MNYFNYELRITNYENHHIITLLNRQFGVKDFAGFTFEAGG